MKTAISVARWLPRILCIVAILFVSMFALDSFSPQLTFTEQIGGFLVHLIPTFILAVILVIAWKWERTGGILFILLGVGFSPLVFMINHHRNHFSGLVSLGIVLMITFPFVLVGGLFLLSHFLGKKLPAIPNAREGGNGKVALV